MNTYNNIDYRLDEVRYNTRFFIPSCFLFDSSYYVSLP